MDGLYEQLRLHALSVWRRRWLALAVAAGLCLVGWLAVALMPNSYESKAKVLAETQSILSDKIGISVAERQSDLLRIKQMLTSNETLTKIIRRTDLNGLVANDRDMAREVTALREDIKITAALDNVIELSATVGVSGLDNRQNARTAAQVVQGLIDLSVEANLSGDEADTGRSLAFLDDQLKRTEEQLRVAEQRRAEFDARFMGVLPGEGSIDQRMSAARLELVAIDREINGAQSSLTSVRSQMAGVPATIAIPGMPAGGGGFAAAQVQQLEGQLSQYQTRGWTDQHPDVVALKSEIARLRPQASAERASGGGASSTPNPSYISLRAMAAEREAQLGAASARKAQIEGGMRQMMSMQGGDPGMASEQARLGRDYEVLKRQYDKLLQDREEVRLRGDVQSKTSPIRFRVIAPPSQPMVPSFPNRPMFLTLILFVAIGAGVGAAFVKGQLQSTFPNQGKLAEVTGLPVLGSVTEVVTRARRALRRRQLTYFAGAGAALAAAYALLMVVEFWQRSTVA